MRALVALLLCAACAGDVTTLDLDLTDGAAPCSRLQVGALESVKIIAYGTHDGETCLVTSECVTVGMETTVEELEATLRAKPQPLLRTTSGVTQVAVLGYNAPLCGETIRLCGFADAADGRVAVPVRCENLLPVVQCSATVVPLCP